MNRLVWLCFVSLLCIHVYAGTVLNPETSSDDLASRREISEGIVAFKRSLPRFQINSDNKLERAPTRLEFSMEYAQGLITLAVPGILFALLSLVGCVLFTVCRCCCNSCGKRKYTGETGYTKKTVWCTRLGTWIAAALVIVAASLGFAGNAQFTAAVGSLFDAFFKIIDIVAGMILEIASKMESIMTALGVPFDSSPYSMMIDMFNSTKALLSDVKEQAVFYDSYRNWGLWLCFSVVMGAGLVFAVIALLKLGLLSMVAALIISVLLTVVWLLFALALPLSVATGDVCYELDIVIEGEEASPLDILRFCIGQEPLQAVYDSMEQAVNGTYMKASQLSSDIKTADGSYGWTDLPIDQDNFGTFKTWVEADSYSPDPDTQPQETANWLQIKALVTIPNNVILLRGILDSIADCMYVTEALTLFYDALCNNMLLSMDLLMAGFGVAGFAGFLLVFCGIRGRKRYMKKYQEAYIMELVMAMEDGEEAADQQYAVKKGRSSQVRATTLHTPEEMAEKAPRNSIDGKPTDKVYGSQPPPPYHPKPSPYST